MNTFSYLSSLLSPSRPAPSPPASPPTPGATLPLPSVDDVHPSKLESHTTTTVDVDVDLTTSPDPDDGDVDSGTEPETLYLSARRNPRAGEPPVVSLSSAPPPHLLGRVDELHGISRKASVKRDKRTSTVGDDEKVPEREKDLEDTAIEVEEEDEVAEGERRLLMKRQHLAASSAREREAHARLSRIWPVRLTVSMYVFLRQLLSFLGIPYSPRSPHNTLLVPSAEKLPMPTTTIDEAPEADSDTSTPTPTRSSFFLRRPSPPSRSPSPALAPTPAPRPPRLTPKTLVLDLDETLIHSTSRPHASSYRNAHRSGLKVRVVEVVLDGRSTVYTVYKRPWVDFFLRKVSTWYTIIIFTASLPEYADPVIDWLDGGDGLGGMVGGRLFRSDCLHANGSYVKDLSVVDADLSRVCLVDNSPVSYAINQANGIPIEGWINDPTDECLLDLLPMLDSLRFTSDVRRVLGLRGFRGEPPGGGARKERERETATTTTTTA